jgi:cytidylate kinase
MIIAVDGPAASGKGTLARAVASHYGLRYLDTGSLYRMVAVSVLRAGGEPEDEPQAAQIALNLDPTAFDDASLRTAQAGTAAAIVAAFPSVRSAILDTQRKFAETPLGAVLDGRDIGTVVCPSADVKLFVSASPEIRARRRYAELKDRGEDISYDQVLAELVKRDERDATRAVSPLKQAEDAHLLDTSELSIETAFARAVTIIDAALDN